MKTRIAALCCLALLLLSGCSKTAEIVRTVPSALGDYYELSDGTWMIDDRIYQYRLVIQGRMPNAARDSEFIYLSNLETIPFDRAWKAAGLSSQLTDYFSPEEATLVEWNTN